MDYGVTLVQSVFTRKLCGSAVDLYIWSIIIIFDKEGLLLNCCSFKIADQWLVERRSSAGVNFDEKVGPSLVTSPSLW